MDANRPHRPPLLRWLIVGALGLGATLMLFCFDPSRYAFYPQCVLHETTGLLCPGCGGLRALHQLLHGHVGAAFNLNPFLVCLAPLLLVFGTFYIAGLISNRRIQFALSPRWFWALFACSCVFGVWRNL